MSEILSESPWTDEVCEEYVNRLTKETANIMISNGGDATDPALVQLWERIPEPVFDYVKRSEGNATTELDSAEKG